MGAVREKEEVVAYEELFPNDIDLDDIKILQSLTKRERSTPYDVYKDVEESIPLRTVYAKLKNLAKHGVIVKVGEERSKAIIKTFYGLTIKGVIASSLLVGLLHCSGELKIMSTNRGELIFGFKMGGEEKKRAWEDMLRIMSVIKNRYNVEFEDTEEGKKITIYLTEADKREMVC